MTFPNTHLSVVACTENVDAVRQQIGLYGQVHSDKQSRARKF